MILKVRPYSLKFISFLVGLSFVMSLSIYLKEMSGREGVGLGETFLWQLLIWLPWILALLVIERVSEILENQKKPLKILILGLLYLSLIIFHWSQFFAVSNLVSPLIGMPETRFGVYRYFFIFWLMIDVVLLWAISIRLNIPEFVEDPPKLTDKTIFSVKKGGATVLIQPNEIKWISAEDYYAKLHTSQGGFLIRKPLKILMRELPPEKFIQVHRSTIVNVSHVSETRKSEDGNYKLLLNDGQERAVSREGIRRFKAAVS